MDCVCHEVPFFHKYVEIVSWPGSVESILCGRSSGGLCVWVLGAYIFRCYYTSWKNSIYSCYKNIGSHQFNLVNIYEKWKIRIYYTWVQNKINTSVVKLFYNFWWNFIILLQYFFILTLSKKQKKNTKNKFLALYSLTILTHKLIQRIFK